MSNKDKIMDAATELFHIYGYDGTSIDMLIKKAGVSKSNFYYYFEGKEELGLSVLTKLADTEIRDFSKIMETDLNVVEQLWEWYKMRFFSQRDLFKQPIYPGSIFGNLALEQSSLNEKFRFVLDKYFRECEALLKDCFRRGIEQGFLKEDLDTKMAAGFMISQFEGAILMAKTKKSLSPIKDVVAQGAGFLLKDEWMHLSGKWLRLIDEP